MPRLDYRATPDNMLQLYEVKLVLAVLLEEINQLRGWAGKPNLSREDVQARVRTYIRAHPKAGPVAGGT